MKIMKRHDGKPIGEYNNSAIYIDKKPEHYMIKFRGFGLSADVIERLHINNIKWIYFRYHGKKHTIYRLTVEKIRNSKKTLNYNGDLQKFVSIQDMSIIGEYER